MNAMMTGRCARWRASAVVSVCGMLAPISFAQVVFTETHVDFGILPFVVAEGPFGGIAAEDFDGDGDIDLFVPNGADNANQLYRNLGGAGFDEIAQDVGLASLEHHRAALWFDYDGDHDLDLLIGGDCGEVPGLPTPCPAGFPNLRLYRQSDEGIFEDVTIEAGLDVVWGLGTLGTYRSGLTAGDLNNDGYLDIAVSAWQGRFFLFQNNTDGTFSEITAVAGIPTSNSRYIQNVIHDFDRDGLMDIYCAIDSGFPNRLYINQGDMTFIDVAPALGVDSQLDDMGVAMGDYNNDGLLDFYVTVVEITTFPTVFYNPLYRNDTKPDGPLEYTEVALILDVGHTGWGWGTSFMDADNDGWQDLAVTNGNWHIGATDDPSKFFLNPGAKGGDFTDVSTAVNFADTYQASGLIAFDCDRDGDLDLAQTTHEGLFRLLRNDPVGDGDSNHYIVIQPRMSGANHWAIGSVVTIQAGGRTTARAVLAGISQASQEPAEAHFGLGDATMVDEIKIEWPGGGETILTDVPADQILIVNAVLPEPTGACCLPDGSCAFVTEAECTGTLEGTYQGDDVACETAACPQPCPSDLDESGDISFADLLQLLAAWGPCEACPEDLDSSGDVGFADLLQLLAAWGPCD